MNWLPDGKKAAICMSVDDVHPSTSRDPFEAGGDLGQGSLKHLEALLDLNPDLRVTLFVTPDWRPVQLVTSRLLARLPMLSEFVYHVDRQPTATFRIDRYPAFVDYLNALPRTDVAPHGLHHVNRGSRLAVEFRNKSRTQCLQILEASMDIFRRAGLTTVSGFSPPGWELPDGLMRALEELEFSFVCSARDIVSPVDRDAVACMSGIRGVSLLRPQFVGRSTLVHIPTNYQATSTLERANQIVDANGVLSIKAHVFKEGGGHSLKDGLDSSYVEHLTGLFADLKRRHGDSLWWASLDAVAKRWRDACLNSDASRLVRRARALRSNISSGPGLTRQAQSLSQSVERG